MIRALAATIVLFLLLVAALGCGEGDGKGESARGRTGETGEIVRVGSAVLTGEDIDGFLPEDERTPLTLEERREFVRRWVETEILCQEAIRRGLRNDPSVQVRLTELEHQFLADYLVFTELRKRAHVSEEEIEAFYAAHESEYLHEYRVSQILTSTLEDAERVQELLATRSWAWVADRYSVDPVAKRGGDLGYLTKGNMIPELEEVVFNMKPGETTGIIKSDFGYHIFRLEDVREALVAVGLDDVREQIMNHLMLEKRKNAYRELIDSLAACAEITYRDKAYLRTSESEPSSGAADISEEADSSAVP